MACVIEWNPSDWNPLAMTAGHFLLSYISALAHMASLHPQSTMDTSGVQAGSNLGCNDAMCAFIFMRYTMTTEFSTTFDESGLRTVVSAVAKDEYIYIEQESTFRDEENKLRTETATVLLNVHQFGEVLAALLRAQVVAMA